MTCDEFENRITEYLDGALATAEVGAFNTHQLSCPACRELLADVSAAIEACNEEPQVEVPLQLLSRTLVIPMLNPPIDCERCQALVTEFLDGYLEPAIYHAFEEHVGACADCSETIAGVALAVSACHSVHFSENLEVPESVVAAILAETTVAMVAGRTPAGRARVWERLQTVFGFGVRPLAAQRFATAALIVLATYGVIVANGGSQGLYDDAARFSSRVYSRSSQLAGETGNVLAEVDRLKSRVGDIFEDDSDRTPDQQPSAAPRKDQGSLGRAPAGPVVG
jgi:anti-sigma factor RsiW